MNIIILYKTYIFTLTFAHYGYLFRFYATLVAYILNAISFVKL